MLGSRLFQVKRTQVKKLLLFTLALLSTVVVVQSQQLNSASAIYAEQHHPTSTHNLEAQSFFDRGLTLVYAFNYDAAGRAFQRAAELDPQLAMAYWGIALASGPNINKGMAASELQSAKLAIQKALSLSLTATAREQAYIQALATRYSSHADPDSEQLAINYKNAMGELVKRYPQDLDAATLYAESAMDLHPWALWTKDGQPLPGTQEIITVLESVLRREPQHLGANHYYIHAVEASLHPAQALASAQRLAQMNFRPAAGHLAHMPAHIYIHTGNYAKAASCNQQAIALDEAYIKSRGGDAMGTFYGHDLDFLAAAYSMEGRSMDALKAAAQIEQLFQPGVPTATFAYVRFHQWAKLLNLRQPQLEATDRVLAWHYARGMALATMQETEQAVSELNSLNQLDQKLTGDLSQDNNIRRIIKIAENVLNARIAVVKGDLQAAIKLLAQAVKMQDSLDYREPTSWYFPVRESLGGLLLLNRNYQAAETVFRADLVKNPGNGRSLFGLLQSLEAQGRKAEAKEIQSQFETAWRNADIQLRVEEL